MISKILFTTFIIMGFALQSETAKAAGCNYDVLGGEYFPWRNGEMTVTPMPLPWNEIQGIWRINEDPTVYLKARVASANKDRKLLSIDIMSVKSCSTQIASGTGYIDAGEQDVIRAVLTDGTYRYQFKLGLFSSTDLKMDTLNCGNSVWAATVKVVGTNPGSNTPLPTDKKTVAPHNMVLRKISSDLNSVCRKSPEK